MLGAESRTGETTESALVPSARPPLSSPPSAVACPKCEHMKAFFNMMQIRSADEPMTICESLFSNVSLAHLSAQFTSAQPLKRCADLIL